MWVCFGRQNRVIRDRFSTLPTTVVPGPEKAIKIWPKHFSAVRKGNDKNRTTNYVGKFWVPNVVFWTPFSTLAKLVAGAWKSRQNWIEFFFHTDGKQ